MVTGVVSEMIPCPDGWRKWGNNIGFAGLVGNGSFVRTKGFTPLVRGGSGVPSGTQVEVAANPALETPGYCQMRLRAHSLQKNCAASVTKSDAGQAIRPRGLKPYRCGALDAALEAPLFHGWAGGRGWAGEVVRL